jgi:thioredoxin 1
MSLIKGNNKNFEEKVINSKVPVLVDFNATWCGPCKMLGPVLEELSSETDKYNIVSVDVDDNQELAASYDVYSIPCLIVFKDGKEVKRTVGFIPKEEVEELMGDL